MRKREFPVELPKLTAKYMTFWQICATPRNNASSFLHRLFFYENNRAYPRIYIGAFREAPASASQSRLHRRTA